MDPNKTAVVLIEYQNDFTSEGGSLHDAVKGVMEQERMLPNTVRQLNRPVSWAQPSFMPPSRLPPITMSSRPHPTVF